MNTTYGNRELFQANSGAPHDAAPRVPNMGVERGQVIGKEHQYFRLLEARDIQVGRQSLGPVVFASPVREDVHSLNSA